VTSLFSYMYTCTLVYLNFVLTCISVHLNSILFFINMFAVYIFWGVFELSVAYLALEGPNAGTHMLCIQLILLCFQWRSFKVNEQTKTFPKMSNWSLNVMIFVYKMDRKRFPGIFSKPISVNYRLSF
jgi:hypothetical protein